MLVTYLLLFVVKNGGEKIGFTLSLSQNFGSIIWIMGSIIWIIFISARHRKYFESKFWTSTKHAALGAQHDIWVVR